MDNQTCTIFDQLYAYCRIGGLDPETFQDLGRRFDIHMKNIHIIPLAGGIIDVSVLMFVLDEHKHEDRWRLAPGQQVECLR